MKLLLSLLLLSWSALAEDIYVKQTASGADSGADAANAHAITWLNASGNWGAGAGKVSAGDTVHLVGAFTTGVQCQGSGSSGQAVTLLFESGANFTKGFWGDTAPAIDLNAKSYITVDGGANGLIQNTANGTGVATNNSVGVGGEAYFARIQNLTITNIYKKTLGNFDDSRVGYPISVFGSSITVSNCTVSDADGGIVYSGALTTQSNIFIQNNTVLNFNHGIVIGIGDTNAYLTNLVISGNFIDHSDVWDCPGNTGIHLDGIIILNNAYDPTSIIDGFFIFRNTFGGNTGSRNTSAIFDDLSDPIHQMRNFFVWNNLFLMNGTNAWGGGFIEAFGTNVQVFNNTCIGTNIGGSWYGGTIYVGGTNAYCFNNLNIGYGVSLRTYTGDLNVTNNNNADNILYLLTTYFNGVWSDKNLFPAPPTQAPGFGLSLWSTAGGAKWQGVNFDTLAQWQTWFNNNNSWPTPIWNTSHADPNSTTNLPSFQSGTYVPVANDTIARGAGTNLTTVLAAAGMSAVDFYGNARSSSGNWTIGAFEDVQGGGFTFLPQLNREATLRGATRFNP